MFSVPHFIWMGICVVLLTVGGILLKKYKPSLQVVLNIACVICILSELIKVFSSIEMVPNTAGTSYLPYLKPQHVPLHLCSLQILTIFYARFAKDGPRKETLLAFMYPTCTLGAFFALLLPSIFSSGSVPLSEAFIHPLAYQFFVFHLMLILLGVYIAASGQVNIRPKHYLSTMGMLGVVAFVMLYLNSLFASPTYVNGKLVSVDYSPNFFFLYKTPVGIKLTELWHWYLYLMILAVLAFGLIALFFIPFFRKKKA